MDLAIATKQDNTDALIAEAIAESVVLDQPPYWGRRLFAVGGYGNSVPYPDDPRRQAYLNRLRYHPMNALFQSAALALIQQVASAPYEIAGKRRAAHFQSVLNNADKARGWESFVSKVMWDYLTLDEGAVIEVIGAGEQDSYLTRELVVGLGVLDPLRCHFTDNYEYPVIYQDIYGGLHQMHHSRVVRLVDMPMAHQELNGIGQCALSRALAWVQQSITMLTYVGESLDNEPPPGILNVGKITTAAQFKEAWDAYEQLRRASGNSTYKPVMKYIQMGEQAAIDFVRFSGAPESFDYEAYTRLHAQGIAAALGIDPQDILPLVGGSFGTNTQSQVLDRKADGRALGFMLKMLERVLNRQVLPDHLEFRFKHRDSEQAQEAAERANIHMLVAAQIETLISKRAALQYLANTVEEFQDLLLDENGQLRLYDDDPIAPEQETETARLVSDIDAEVAPDVATVDESDKDYADTERLFLRDFMEAIGAGVQKDVDRRRFGIITRALLTRYGRKAYTDGLAEGGVQADVLEGDDLKAFNRWLVEQSKFVTNFANEVYRKGLTDAQIRQRASLWTENSIGGARLLGLKSADRNGLYAWRMSPEAEHCEDCQRLNGQTHRLKAWLSRGLQPRSDVLQCKLGCKCKLEKTQGRSRGRFLGRKA